MLPTAHSIRNRPLATGNLNKQTGWVRTSYISVQSFKLFMVLCEGLKTYSNLTQEYIHKDQSFINNQSQKSIKIRFLGIQKRYAEKAFSDSHTICWTHIQFHSVQFRKGLMEGVERNWIESVGLVSEWSCNIAGREWWSSLEIDWVCWEEFLRSDPICKPTEYILNWEVLT